MAKIPGTDYKSQIQYRVPNVTGSNPAYTAMADVGAARAAANDTVIQGGMSLVKQIAGLVDRIQGKRAKNEVRKAQMDYAQRFTQFDNEHFGQDTAYMSAGISTEDQQAVLRENIEEIAGLRAELGAIDQSLSELLSIADPDNYQKAQVSILQQKKRDAKNRLTRIGYANQAFAEATQNPPMRYERAPEDFGEFTKQFERDWGLDGTKAENGFKTKRGEREFKAWYQQQLIQDFDVINDNVVAMSMPMIRDERAELIERTIQEGDLDALDLLVQEAAEEGMFSPVEIDAFLDDGYRRINLNAAKNYALDLLGTVDPNSNQAWMLDTSGYQKAMAFLNGEPSASGSPEIGLWYKSHDGQTKTFTPEEIADLKRMVQGQHDLQQEQRLKIRKNRTYAFINEAYQRAANGTLTRGWIMNDVRAQGYNGQPFDAYQKALGLLDENGSTTETFSWPNTRLEGMFWDLMRNRNIPNETLIQWVAMNTGAAGFNIDQQAELTEMVNKDRRTLFGNAQAGQTVRPEITAQYELIGATFDELIRKARDDKDIVDVNRLTQEKSEALREFHNALLQGVNEGLFNLKDGPEAAMKLGSNIISARLDKEIAKLLDANIAYDRLGRGGVWDRSNLSKIEKVIQSIQNLETFGSGDWAQKVNELELFLHSMTVDLSGGKTVIPDQLPTNRIEMFIPGDGSGSERFGRMHPKWGRRGARYTFEVENGIVVQKVYDYSLQDWVDLPEGQGLSVLNIYPYAGAVQEAIQGAARDAKEQIVENIENAPDSHQERIERYSGEGEPDQDQAVYGSIRLPDWLKRRSGEQKE